MRLGWQVTVHPMRPDLTPLDPIKALYWSAVINGVVAVPVMSVMMIITAQRKIMKKFIIVGWLRWLGWLRPRQWPCR